MAHRGGTSTDRSTIDDLTVWLCAIASDAWTLVCVNAHSAYGSAIPSLRLTDHHRRSVRACELDRIASIRDRLMDLDGREATACVACAHPPRITSLTSISHCRAFDGSTAPTDELAASRIAHDTTPRSMRSASIPTHPRPSLTASPRQKMNGTEAIATLERIVQAHELRVRHTETPQTQLRVLRALPDLLTQPKPADEAHSANGASGTAIVATVASLLRSYVASYDWRADAYAIARGEWAPPVGFPSSEVYVPKPAQHDENRNVHHHTAILAALRHLHDIIPNLQLKAPKSQHRYFHQQRLGQ
jgi:hypothetical protein